MNVDEIPPILLFLQIKVHHHENILGFFSIFLPCLPSCNWREVKKVSFGSESPNDIDPFILQDIEIFPFNFYDYKSF